MGREIIKIGTRGSILALKQVHLAIKKIKKHPYSKFYKFEVVKIKTKGDNPDNFNDKNIKNHFTKDIQNELIQNNIQIAIHSAKDMSVFENDETLVMAFLKRSHVADAFISHKYKSIQDLKSNSKIGTSSIRRNRFCNIYINGIDILKIRGNIETRINKMLNNEYDALILAKCALTRLKIKANKLLHIQDLPIDKYVPPIGQGAIAIELNKNVDKKLIKIIKDINHKKTYEEVSAERLFGRKISANCDMPVGCNVSINGNIAIINIKIGNNNENIIDYNTNIQVHKDELLSEISNITYKILNIR